MKNYGSIRVVVVVPIKGRDSLKRRQAISDHLQEHLRDCFKTIDAADQTRIVCRPMIPVDVANKLNRRHRDKLRIRRRR
jgi:hypothetical protein